MEQKPRYHLLDSLRAIALINMIAYHAMYDLVYIFGVRAKWYMTEASDIWQMFICCTFIILSGFCWQLGGKKLKRGLVVLAGSAIITLVTVVFMPSQKILFGVLSLIGSAMIIMIPLHHVFKRINPFVGAIFACFYIRCLETSTTAECIYLRQCCLLFRRRYMQTISLHILAFRRSCSRQAIISRFCLGHSFILWDTSYTEFSLVLTF